MPLLQNAKKEIVQVYEPEVEKLLKTGWKEVTDKAEEVYRAMLSKDQSLTSAASIEERRVKAGVYDALNKVVGAVKSDVKKAEQTAKKSAGSKAASIVKKVVGKTNAASK